MTMESSILIEIVHRLKLSNQPHHALYYLKHCVLSKELLEILKLDPSNEKSLLVKRIVGIDFGNDVPIGIVSLLTSFFLEMPAVSPNTDVSLLLSNAIEAICSEVNIEVSPEDDSRQIGQEQKEEDMSMQLDAAIDHHCESNMPYKWLDVVDINSSADHKKNDFPSQMADVLDIDAIIPIPSNDGDILQITNAYSNKTYNVPQQAFTSCHIDNSDGDHSISILTDTTTLSTALRFPINSLRNASITKNSSKTNQLSVIHYAFPQRLYSNEPFINTMRKEDGNSNMTTTNGLMTLSAPLIHQLSASHTCNGSDIDSHSHTGHRAVEVMEEKGTLVIPPYLITPCASSLSNEDDGTSNDSEKDASSAYDRDNNFCLFIREVIDVDVQPYTDSSKKGEMVCVLLSGKEARQQLVVKEKENVLENKVLPLIPSRNTNSNNSNENRDFGGDTILARRGRTALSVDTTIPFSTGPPSPPSQGRASSVFHRFARLRDTSSNDGDGDGDGDGSSSSNHGSTISGMYPLGANIAPWRSDPEWNYHNTSQGLFSDRNRNLNSHSSHIGDTSSNLDRATNAMSTENPFYLSSDDEDAPVRPTPINRGRRLRVVPSRSHLPPPDRTKRAVSLLSMQQEDQTASGLGEWNSRQGNSKSSDGDSSIGTSSDVLSSFGLHPPIAHYANTGGGDAKYDGNAGNDGDDGDDDDTKYIITPPSNLLLSPSDECHYYVYFGVIAEESMTVTPLACIRLSPPQLDQQPTALKGIENTSSDGSAVAVMYGTQGLLRLVSASLSNNNIKGSDIELNELNLVKDDFNMQTLQEVHSSNEDGDITHSSAATITAVDVIAVKEGVRVLSGSSDGKVCVYDISSDDRSFYVSTTLFDTPYLQVAGAVYGLGWCEGGNCALVGFYNTLLLLRVGGNGEERDLNVLDSLATTGAGRALYTVSTSTTADLEAYISGNPALSLTITRVTDRCAQISHLERRALTCDTVLHQMGTHDTGVLFPSTAWGPTSHVIPLDGREVYLSGDGVHSPLQTNHDDPRVSPLYHQSTIDSSISMANEGETVAEVERGTVFIPIATVESRASSGGITLCQWATTVPLHSCGSNNGSNKLGDISSVHPLPSPLTTVDSETSLAVQPDVVYALQSSLLSQLGTAMERAPTLLDSTSAYSATAPLAHPMTGVIPALNSLNIKQPLAAALGSITSTSVVQDVHRYQANVQKCYTRYMDRLFSSSGGAESIYWKAVVPVIAVIAAVQDHPDEGATSSISAAALRGAHNGYDSDMYEEWDSYLSLSLLAAIFDVSPLFMKRLLQTREMTALIEVKTEDDMSMASDCGNEGDVSEWGFEAAGHVISPPESNGTTPNCNSPMLSSICCSTESETVMEVIGCTEGNKLIELAKRCKLICVSIAIDSHVSDNSGIGDGDGMKDIGDEIHADHNSTDSDINGAEIIQLRRPLLEMLPLVRIVTGNAGGGSGSAPLGSHLALEYSIDVSIGHSLISKLYLHTCGNKSVAIENSYHDYLKQAGTHHLSNSNRLLRTMTTSVRKIDETANMMNRIPKQLGFVSGLQEIYARRVGLKGTLPSELGNLHHLRVLSMGNNSIRGKIPESYGNLTFLQRIVLHQNKLSGKVPQSLSDSGCIVNIAGNPQLDLGEDVPIVERSALRDLFISTGGENWSCKTNWLSDVEVSNWYKVGTLSSHVHSIVMSSNKMNGAIPNTIKALTKLRMIEFATMPSLYGTLEPITQIVTLRRLCICRCQITGPIPEAIGNLSELEELQLFGNKLQGIIPESLGKLSKLKLLSLGEYTGGNNFKAGPIPSCIQNLHQLEALFLSSCNLTGTVPEWLSTLTELRQVDLQNNHLGGLVSHSTFAGLSNLLYLNLKDNRKLCGPLPVRALASLRKLNRLSFVNTDFEVPADLLPYLKSKLPTCKVWM